MSMTMKTLDKVPIADAPRGLVWRWNTYRIAHLVFATLRQQAVCGVRVRGSWQASQVGGYSARPCQACLEASDA
jgi:hypothetical protein